MQRAIIQRIVGLLLMVFSVAMLPPAGIGLWYGDGEVFPFVSAFLTILIIGLILWFPVRGTVLEVRLRGGFIIVAAFWLTLGLSGSLPFMLSENPHMSLTDSVFESVSALTTTGATVITGIDHLPHSILFYRQQLQWMGGMGIIVLAVAILPVFIFISGFNVDLVGAQDTAAGPAASQRPADLLQSRYLRFDRLTADDGLSMFK